MGLYNPLIAGAKEHRRIIIPKASQISIEDVNAKSEALRYQHGIDSMNVKKVRKENEKLRFEHRMKEYKLEILNWYLEVMEEGIDTKEVTHKYLELKKKHNQLIKKTDNKIA